MVAWVKLCKSPYITSACTVHCTMQYITSYHTSIAGKPWLTRGYQATRRATRTSTAPYQSSSRRTSPSRGGSRRTMRPPSFGKCRRWRSAVAAPAAAPSTSNSRLKYCLPRDHRNFSRYLICVFLFYKLWRFDYMHCGSEGVYLNRNTVNLLTVFITEIGSSRWGCFCSIQIRLLLWRREQSNAYWQWQRVHTLPYVWSHNAPLKSPKTKYVC